MKLFLGSILLLAVAFFEIQARAQTETIYIGPSTGAFEDSANWSEGIPNATALALISPGGFIDDTNGTVSSEPTTITITESSNQAAEGIFVAEPYDTVNGVQVTQGAGVVNLQLSSGSTLTVGANSAAYGLEVTNNTTLAFSGGTLQIDSGGLTIGESFDGTEFEGLGAVTITSGTIDVTGDVYVGTGSGSTGTMSQSGSSTVTIVGDLDVGDTGSTGTYNLSSGNLSVSGTLDLADASGSTGTFNQTGGDLTTEPLSDVIVGGGGIGVFNLSAGTDNFGGTFEVGEGGTGTFNQTGGGLTVGGVTQIGSSTSGTFNLSAGTVTFNGALDVGVQGAGILNQTGGTLTANALVTISDGAAGTYDISAGFANFNTGLVVGADGTVTQSGGTVTIASGQTLDLSAVGSSYNLNSGVLKIGNNGTNGIFGTAGEGTLNFGGGTLRILSGSTDFIDPLNGSVTGNSTLDTTGGDITLSGALAGSGGFTMTGGGTVTLTAGLATYSGNTYVEGTSLDLDVPAAADTTTTFASSILGSNGALNIIFTNASTLQLTGSNNDFTGTTTIGDGGTLGVGNGTFGSFAASTGSVIIGGSGSNGTVSFLGTNRYTGTTTIDPSFTFLATNVDSATLTNNGTLGVLPSAAVGTNFLVGPGGTGDLVQAEGTGNSTTETLLVRTLPTGDDMYTVGAGTLYQNIHVTGYGKIGQNIFTIVSSATPLVTGTLNASGPTGLDADTHSALFSATLSLTNGNRDLVLDTNQLPLSQFATTPNQLAVANALDYSLERAGQNPLFEAFDSFSTTAPVAETLDELTPRNALYMRDIAFENSTFLAQSLDSRLAALRSGFSGLDTSGLSILTPGLDSDLGRSLMAYNNQTVAPNGVNYYPDDDDGTSSTAPYSTIQPREQTISDSPDAKTMVPAPGPIPGPTGAAKPGTFDGTRFNEFVSGDGVLGNLDQNNGANHEPKASYVGADATVGVSFRMTSNLAAGVLFNYNHTDALTDAQGSHVRVDTYSPGVFATYFERGVYVNALASFGYNNYSDNRNVNLAGTNYSANSSPSGQDYVGDLDGGYDFHPDKHWIIGPVVGIEYTHLDIDSYSESGGGPTDLSVGSQSADSLQGRIGGHVVYQAHAGSVLFQPNFTAQFQHEFLNDPFILNSSFDGIAGNPSFQTQGSNPGRNTALLGFGLTATLDNAMSLYLNYLAEVGGDDYFVQSVQGGVKASF